MSQAKSTQLNDVADANGQGSSMRAAFNCSNRNETADAWATTYFRGSEEARISATRLVLVLDKNDPAAFKAEMNRVMQELRRLRTYHLLRPRQQ